MEPLTLLINGDGVTSVVVFGVAHQLHAQLVLT